MREMSGVLRETVRPQTMKARRALQPPDFVRQLVERVLAAVEAVGIVHRPEVGLIHWIGVNRELLDYRDRSES